MLFSIAWKNIWRKPSRSLVLTIAIVIGLSGGVFTISYSEGMIKQRNEDAINLNYSHFQIHKPEFNENQKLRDSIIGAEKIIKEIEQQENILAVTSRLKFFGMATTARANQGVMIIGIDVEKEKIVTTIHTCLIDSNSRFLDTSSTNEIIISTRMARNLMIVSYIISDREFNIFADMKMEDEIISNLKNLENIEIRSKSALRDSLRVVLNSEEFEKYADIITDVVTQYKSNKKLILKFTDSYGNLVEEAFKVVGIYKTNDAMFDNLNVFVNKKYLAKITNVGSGSATEISGITKNINKADLTVKNLKTKYEKLLVQGFMELDPMMVAKGDFINIYYYFIIGFILFALSFGIVNTVLMSVLERTKELGMLMAVGMKKSKIFVMIMLESIFISLFGGVIGMFVGAAISVYFGIVGISFGKYAGAAEAFGLGGDVYPVLNADFFIGTTVLVILAGVLSAIYPARRALKLNPSEAVRSDA